MSETTTAVAKKEDKEIVYKPFGGSEDIKLSIAIIRNQIAVPTRQGKLPTDNDCIKFLMLCKARLLNPWEGDCFLIGYDGAKGPQFSLITAHQAFLKRAEVNPEYDGMKSGIIIEENNELKDLEGDFYISPAQKVVGGWATVFFKNRKYPMHKRIRVSRFNKGLGLWNDDSAGMICKCAEADALRSSFPTMLGGLYLKEETQPDAVTVSAPIFNTTAQEPAKSAEEVVIDVTPPAEVKVAAVPAQPAAAKAPKAAVKAPAAPKAPPTAMEALKARLEASGVSVKEVIKTLATLNLVDDLITTLEEATEKFPDAIQLLQDDFDSIVSDIKSKQSK